MISVPEIRRDTCKREPPRPPQQLPRLGGLDVLAAIRGEERIKHLPVVVLTSSDDDKDRLAAYERYANSYIRKPVDYDEFVIASRELKLYWLVLKCTAASRTTGS